MSSNMLVTGRTGEPHVYAADDARLYRQLFGEDTYIIPEGSKFSIASYTNSSVTINDGYLISQGRLMGFPLGKGTVTLEFDTSTLQSGYARKDAIVMAYWSEIETTQVDVDGATQNIEQIVEYATLGIVTGTPTSGTSGTLPDLQSGDMDNGATNYILLYVVNWNGLSVDSIDSSQMPTTLSTSGLLSTLNEAKATAISEIEALRSTFSEATALVEAATAKYEEAKDAYIENLKTTYPVGRLYISTESTDPAEILGFGLWLRINGRFLLAVGHDPKGVYTSESMVTGGESAHTLTVDELPAHDHGEGGSKGSMRVMAWNGGGVSGNITSSNVHTDKTPPSGEKEGAVTFTINGIHSHATVGSGVAHGNVPPYFSVYVWYRAE